MRKRQLRSTKAVFGLETLDGRVVPAVVPPANIGMLATVYQDYVADGGDTTTFATQMKNSFPSFTFKGNMVEVDIAWNGQGNINTLANAMKNLGMTSASGSGSPVTSGRIVEGFLPINQLATAGNYTQTLSISPVLTPNLSSGGSITAHRAFF
jgi:hypothetical protein